MALSGGKSQPMGVLEIISPDDIDREVDGNRAKRPNVDKLHPAIKGVVEELGPNYLDPRTHLCAIETVPDELKKKKTSNKKGSKTTLLPSLELADSLGSEKLVEKLENDKDFRGNFRRQVAIDMGLPGRAGPDRKKIFGYQRYTREREIVKNMVFEDDPPLPKTAKTPVKRKGKAPKGGRKGKASAEKSPNDQKNQEEKPKKPLRAEEKRKKKKKNIGDQYERAKKIGCYHLALDVAIDARIAMMIDPYIVLGYWNSAFIIQTYHAFMEIYNKNIFVALALPDAVWEVIQLHKEDDNASFDGMETDLEDD